VACAGVAAGTDQADAEGSCHGQSPKRTSGR
jgi:hypothetical protein